ncbi:cytochrome b/b6 domain-containing protein [Paucibacter sp. KCTC 42545]|uniref:cytochrome b/b6 domain-containing protein n=1 Tax=Paucibacter sp. KCTC 42545 TaxID=1768242 RepID=UPI001E2C6E47|nr:cytochrome b/b6 domain-containing protein [Paucibacter sp. KCTC 42545]
MNTMSASPAKPADSADAAGSHASASHTPGASSQLIWDLPQRLVHWLMVLSFSGAYLTAETERWRLVHVSLGYTLAGLVIFRLVWGLLGSRHARFANFVRGPAAVLTYLRGLLQGRPQHFAGHNPAGALAIVAMLGLALGLTASGYATYTDLGGEWLEETHELLANGLLAVIGLHVLGVLVSSWLHRENLPRAMITGRKLAGPEQGIRRSWAPLAALILVAVLGFWAWQWQQAPVVSAATAQQHHDDDE